MQSPVSAIVKNRLSLSNLSQFGDGNNRLSGSRSSSSSSRGRSRNAPSISNASVPESTTTPLAWRIQRDPVVSYGRFELPDNDDNPPATSLLTHAGGSTETTSTCHSHPHNHIKISAKTYQSLCSTQSQYDGVEDDSKGDSPAPFARPTTYAIGSKRKASESRIASFTKRPRKTLRRWAQRLGEKVRNRHRCIAHWKARHKRVEEIEANGAKVDESGSSFYTNSSPSKDREEHEDWWMEGVKKYRAPAWMRFHHSPKL